MRADKWLWVVRLYKTRSLASEACRLQKIKIADNPVKASRELKLQDVLSIHTGPFYKTVQVLGFPAQRLPAKEVLHFMLDLTPPEIYQNHEMSKKTQFEFRDRGLGRPTKKERRNIQTLKTYLDREY